MQVPLEQIRAVVRQYLPAGPFWNQPGPYKEAADRWVNAIALALNGTGAVLGTPEKPGIVEFVSCLNVYMRPETTPFRSVLLQYYEYLQIPTCTPIPEDLEALRAIVVGANTAAPVYTPSGLRSWINAQLPLVEVTESLPLMVPPFVPPVPADGWWAVVEIWYSPLIYPESTVLCVARPVAPGSNDIRLVQPQAVWSITPTAPPVVRGDEVALLWSEQRADTDLTVRRYDAGMVLQETAILAAVTPGDAAYGFDIFPGVGAATDVQGETWTVDASRSFADFPTLGSVPTMATESITL
jgi:hypothetical protein